MEKDVAIVNMPLHISNYYFMSYLIQLLKASFLHYTYIVE